MIENNILFYVMYFNKLVYIYYNTLYLTLCQKYVLLSFFCQKNIKKYLEINYEYVYNVFSKGGIFNGRNHIKKIYKK